MHIGLSSGQCKPLYCQGYQVGLVRKDVEAAIEPFTDVFSISTSQIDIMPMYNHVAQTKSTFEEISKNIDNVLQSLRDSPDHDFLALKGWRNECYNIRPSFSSPPLFKMERSATCKITSSNMSRSFSLHILLLPLLFTNSTLHIFFATGMFGLRQYGVDINGYVKDPEKGLCVWMQRRSISKPTWPDKWDNFVCDQKLKP